MAWQDDEPGRMSSRNKKPTKPTQRCCFCGGLVPEPDTRRSRDGVYGPCCRDLARGQG
jgi:hypothetical protein